MYFSCITFLLEAMYCEDWDLCYLDVGYYAFYFNDISHVTLKCMWVTLLVSFSNYFKNDVQKQHTVSFVLAPSTTISISVGIGYIGFNPRG